jgi:transcriptional regulator with XRE-family HTH domain
MSAEMIINREALKNFGKRLAAVRLAYGAATGSPALSRMIYADLLDIECERYRRYERGETNPPIFLLQRIRELTGISLDYLISGLDYGAEIDFHSSGGIVGSLGRRLRHVREAYGAPAHKVAALMGISVQTLDAWETDRTPMPLDMMADFSRRFTVPIDYLVRNDMHALPELLRERLQSRPPEDGRRRHRRRRFGMEMARETTSSTEDCPPTPDH